jgi:death-on-curing protein
VDRFEEPRWVPRVAVDAVHLDLIREHGGLSGIRDEDALESALARPKQTWAYDEEPDLADLAAAYGFGLARNHPYHDGNKRIAFVTMAVFLGLNGATVRATEEEIVAVMLELAGGTLSEGSLAEWVREHEAPR